MKKIKPMAYILGVILIFNLLFVNMVYAGETNEMILEYDGQTHIYKERPIQLVVRGKDIQGEMPPIVFNGNTLVPIREVFEAMEAVVEWKPETKEVYAGMNDTLVILKTNSNIAWVNGEDKNIPMAPKIINNKVMIPIRFVAETIGFNVEWMKSERIVKIDLPEGENNNNELEKPIEDKETNNETDKDAPIPDIPVESDFNRDIPKLPTKLATNPIIVESKPDSSKEQTPPSIERVQNPTTDIIGIQSLDTTGGSQFKVSASSPITFLEHMALEGNKIVIDIDNANMKLSQTNITVENSNTVKSIRSSQFSSNPKVVRVVFDLKNQGDYNIRMASDRRSFILEMKKANLNRVELSQNSRGDVLTLYGSTNPNVKVLRLTNPNRLVIDIPYIETNLEDIEELVRGQYVKGIRTARFDGNTYRIVLDVDNQPEYEVVSSGKGKTSVQIIPPTYKNIRYINQDKTQVMIKKPSKDFDIKTIKHDDDYMNRIYKIILPEDYYLTYGEGVFHLGDGKLDSIQIGRNSNNKTEFKFIQKSVFAYDVLDEGEYIIISILKPTEKYSKIMVLDAGHGGKDPGALGNGLVEKELNLDITLKLNALLASRPDIKVYNTRTSDTYPSLEDRSKLANEIGADIFVSVHNNSFTSEHKGTETLYFPTHLDTTAQFSGKKMAQIFQNVLVQQLGTKDRGLKERPGLYVLRTTKMPAVIIEVAFLSNKDDANLLRSDSFRQNAAKAIFEGILTIFERYPTNR